MDILHQKGDVVVCACPRGYALTEGKQYEVLKVVPPIHMEIGFTFPSYVVVRDDLGRAVECHHHRFRPVSRSAS